MFEKEVAAGAKWLDRVKPGWAESIDLGRLNMDDFDSCILGQLCSGNTAQDGWRNPIIKEEMISKGFGLWKHSHILSGYWRENDILTPSIIDHGVYYILTQEWIPEVKRRKELITMLKGILLNAPTHTLST